MKPRNDSYHGKTVFAIGFAVLALAALLAVQITLRPVPVTENHRSDDLTTGSTTRGDSLRENTNAAGPMTPHGAERAPLPRPGAGAGFDRAGDRPDRPVASVLAARSEARPFRLEVPREHPQQPRLAEQAERIAAHANRRLDVLTGQLDLTSAQRDKLFPLLARSSPNFDPAMAVADADGAPLRADPRAGGRESGPDGDDPDPASLSAAVVGLLEPTQQEEWVERRVNDAALWREIFTNLQRQLEQQTPEIPAAAEDTPPPARRNIFELVDPAN